MLPLKRKRQPHYYTEIRDKKVHSEPHLKHRKNEIVPAKKIGPDCKWHVRNRDNIARVRKDEAAAADEEKEIQNRKRKAEQEAKIELLRSQIKNKTCSTLKFENKLVSGIAESQHINLFHTGEFLAKNEEHERELKEEKEKYEKQIGYLTYLGQGTNEADGCVSWYNKSKFEFKNSLKTDFQKDEKLKSALDPLNGIDTILEKKRCYLDNLSKYSKLQEKQLKLTNKEDDMKNKISRKREKDNKIEILREKRLKREKEEKMKIERLLIELKKEKDCGSIQEKEFTPTFLQKYNSQFNPHLARQNHKQ